MKKKLLLLCLVLMLAAMPVAKTQAAAIPIIQIIREAVIKVIKAVDLMIQRLQTKTIWLQNAQKTIENEMSKLKLDEITDWVDKQKDLYADYFDELRKVKAVISYYYKVKEIIDKQKLIVSEYEKAFALFKQDKNFTADEIAYMEKVYSGILDQSIKNLDAIFIVINSFETQMSDAARLAIISNVAADIDTNFDDLRQFNQQNIIMSLQRAKQQSDVDVVKKLYGLE
ncbi:conjugal transfer protein TraI [Panacibacter ginsenosidivorans]|uniref:Conjugal transfer protein TraI n=1 Tax=Panacibacter ginsenosidivorans TaxID=1813871 RepID=A0A5B8VDD0_9BACT|nr:conjugal transfer protein TraI [Panacibacter ginsenosidivorans]QEC69279.1 conjugal transfer protein TraI [Panacibacter ginsenosidivorans]